MILNCLQAEEIRQRAGAHACHTLDPRFDALHINAPKHCRVYPCCPQDCWGGHPSLKQNKTAVVCIVTHKHFRSLTVFVGPQRFLQKMRLLVPCCTNQDRAGYYGPRVQWHRNKLICLSYSKSGIQTLCSIRNVRTWFLSRHPQVHMRCCSTSFPLLTASQNVCVCRKWAASA